jgi:hypothetical protein
VHENIHIEASPFAIKPNRFHSRVETDFVPKLETVGKRFLGAVYAHAYTVELMSLDACTIGLI